MQTLRNVMTALLVLLAVGFGAKFTDVPEPESPDALPPNTIHIPSLGVEP